MDIFTLSAFLGAIVAIGGSVYTIWSKIIRPVVNWLRKMAGLLETMEKEFKPNGGSSMRDAINRIELRQIIADQRVKALDNDSIRGVWEADQEGKLIHTNRTYQRIVGSTAEALDGFGWVNTIHPEDRESVMKEWDSAVKQQREFYGVFRLKNKKKVVSVGYPLRHGDKVHKWAGILIEESEEGQVFFDDERV
jgi:PAS domain S-box-containing protein